MTFLEAAYQVLQEVGEPLHFREITERALARGLVETGGKTPAASLNAMITLDVKRAAAEGEVSRFVRVGRGIIGLREWDSPAPAVKESMIKEADSTMGIPDYQSIMLPLMKLASDGEEHTMREAFEVLAGEFATALWLRS